MVLGRAWSDSDALGKISVGRKACNVALDRSSNGPGALGGLISIWWKRCHVALGRVLSGSDCLGGIPIVWKKSSNVALGSPNALGSIYVGWKACNVNRSVTH